LTVYYQRSRPRNAPQYQVVKEPYKAPQRDLRGVSDQALRFIHQDTVKNKLLNLKNNKQKLESMNTWCFLENNKDSGVAGEYSTC
jgi:hypothetical protein